MSNSPKTEDSKKVYFSVGSKSKFETKRKIPQGIFFAMVEAEESANEVRVVALSYRFIEKILLNHSDLQTILDLLDDDEDGDIDLSASIAEWVAEVSNNPKDSSK